MKKIFLIPVLFSLYNCQQLSDSFNNTLNPNDSIVQKKLAEPEEVKVPDFDLLKKPEILKKAESDLHKLPEFAGKEIFIYRSIQFYNDGRILTQIQNPSNLKQIDEYVYEDLKWSKSDPVQLSASRDIQNDLFALNKIKFETAVKIAAICNEKATKIEGVKLIDYVYVVAWERQPEWHPRSIDGSRDRYSISFNLDGTLKEFKQD
nr:hypothetical protein [uncultured Flavobacterium sp.]